MDILIYNNLYIVSYCHKGIFHHHLFYMFYHLYILFLLNMTRKYKDYLIVE